VRYNRSQIEAQKKKQGYRYSRKPASEPKQEQAPEQAPEVNVPSNVITTPFPAEPEHKTVRKKKLKIKTKDNVKEQKPEKEQKPAKTTIANPSEQQIEEFKKKIKEILNQ